MRFFLGDSLGADEPAVDRDAFDTGVRELLGARCGTLARGRGMVDVEGREGGAGREADVRASASAARLLSCAEATRCHSSCGVGCLACRGREGAEINNEGEG